MTLTVVIFLSVWSLVNLFLFVGAIVRNKKLTKVLNLNEKKQLTLTEDVAELRRKIRKEVVEALPIPSAGEEFIVDTATVYKDEECLRVLLAWKPIAEDLIKNGYFVRFNNGPALPTLSALNEYISTFSRSTWNNGYTSELSAMARFDKRPKSKK